jgi:hypothetical protein
LESGWDQVESQVRVEYSMTYYTFSSYVNYTDFGLLSFFDYMDEVLHINMNKDLKRWYNWAESSFMSIQLDGLCIVSNFPKHISRNDENDLHSLEGYAISFDDGYGLNYVNGKFLPENIFNEINGSKYLLETFLKESNEEIKSAAIEMMQLVHGDSFLVRFFGDNLKEIDSYVDKKED